MTLLIVKLRLFHLSHSELPEVTALISRLADISTRL
jgi:hypothetical protein